MRLRRARVDGPGYRRRRAGAGWTYWSAEGQRITDPDVLSRISSLTIPPAWTDVWICPWPNGHIQATGVDAAGRRQYLYHPEWRARRDAAKHERVLDMARRLPEARARVTGDLGRRGYPRQRVLAVAFRLLDLGFFRVGGEAYAEEHGTYGLATMRREHVRFSGDTVIFDYLAKGSKQRVQALVDPRVRRILGGLVRRDDPSPELLAYRDGPAGRGPWRDVRSSDINDYVREVLGMPATAKDFRTWHATVLMAVGLAVSVAAPDTAVARRRAVSRAIGEVASYLGNTPTVCRSSYIDPRVIDLYEQGRTIRGALDQLGAGGGHADPATHGAVEQAVLDLLTADGEVGGGQGLRRPAR